MPTWSYTNPTNGSSLDATVIANNNNALAAIVNGGIDGDNLSTVPVAKIADGTTGQTLRMGASDPEWATAGMQFICTHTVSVAQASIDTNTLLSGALPTGYTHLKIIMQGLGTTADTAVPVKLRFNNDSGANYYDQRLIGAGATASADEALAATAGRIGNIPGSTATAALSSIEVVIPNYRGTVFRKAWSSASMHASNTSTGTLQSAQLGGFWNSTAAITRVAVIPNSGNFDVGTIFSLYGLG